MKQLCGCEGVTRLSDEDPEREGLASEHLKCQAVGGGGEEQEELGKKPSGGHPPAAERSPWLEIVAAASPGTIESRDQAGINSQDQFTTG